MSAVPNASVVFLPWVRQGAAAAINVADTLGANMRGAVDLKATLAINSVPGDPITVRLRGPADVVGIDPHEIVRVDPKPNTTDFEPNYFPGIEFDRPDFPWLFTPAKAGENAKLRPWLCLVIVRQQEGVLLSSSADAPLPILNINGPAKPVDELPDLVDSWAWVHAQVAASSLAEADPTALKNDIRTRPERSLSRLLCPRILQPNTDYVACVVPTFELGRKAGLGEEIKDTELTAANGLLPAWSFTPNPPTSARLPVYYHWRFRTGCPNCGCGNFGSVGSRSSRRTRCRIPLIGIRLECDRHTTCFSGCESRRNDFCHMAGSPEVDSMRPWFQFQDGWHGTQRSPVQHHLSAICWSNRDL